MHYLKPFSLFCLVMVVCFSVPSVLKAQSQQNECRDVEKISIDIIHTSGNSDNGKVIVHANAAKLSEYNCILYAKQRTDNRLNFKLVDGMIDHLKAGTYTLFIQDNSGDGCTRQFSIKIN
jgi:hypothetical protein